MSYNPKHEEGAPTIHIVPLLIRPMPITWPPGSSMHTRSRTAHSQGLEQRKRATNPPRVAPIDELVSATLETTKVRLAALHMHQPPQQPPRIDVRRVGCSLGLHERAQHHPRRKRAERVPSVRLAQRRFRALHEFGLSRGSGEKVWLGSGGEAALVRLARRHEARGAGNELGCEQVEEMCDHEQTVGAPDVDLCFV